MVVELLIVPVKKPYEVDVVKPLKNLINSYYSDKSSEFNEAAAEFGKLRSNSVFKVYEKFESSLPVIYNYFDQICSLETKIPVQELQIPFKYKDAFDKGSIFGSKMSLTLSSLSFEKVCTLFNIAALQSAVASGVNFDSDEGLQLAVKLLQQASGIFLHLKVAAATAIPQEPTPDLNPDCLQVLSSLLLAQAQEVFVSKVIKDNNKELLIAKLCCQGEEMYADVLKCMQKDSLRALWDKEWIPTIAGKQAAFHGLTMLYMSLHNRANKQIGQEISRLQKSIELFKAAQQRSGKPAFFEEFLNRAQRNLTEAKKDNDFIYNEQIPDVNSLDGPGKTVLAKPTPLQSPLIKDFKDLFKNFVPVAVQHALSAFEGKKNEIVNAEIIKLREATQTLNAILSSLNLPAAIEQVDKGVSVPPSLIEKSNNIREKGGVSSVRSLIEQLPSALERNQQILDESERMLQEEWESDKQLRDQFKEKWTRTTSEKLTENFRASASKYREIINNAVMADKVVREKFESNVQGMEILSLSIEELQKAIPASSNDKSSISVSAKKLRELMQSVDDLKKKRDALESELKLTTFDMKEKLMSALAVDGALDETSVTISNVGKALIPYQRKVTESLTNQEQIVSEIQEQHKAFSVENGVGANARDGLLKQLALSYDVYMELQNNLKEGTKFYNDLTELLLVFQSKISDFCFARKTEKDELLKDLTSASSRSPLPTTPSLPAHHSNTYENISSTSASTPYPLQPSAMPVPFGGPQAPFAPFMPPPLPQCFNPYATLPYPNAYQFPQGPQQPYGTWPGNFHQGNYPHQQ